MGLKSLTFTFTCWIHKCTIQHKTGHSWGPRRGWDGGTIFLKSVQNLGILIAFMTFGKLSCEHLYRHWNNNTVTNTLMQSQVFACSKGKNTNANWNASD